MQDKSSWNDISVAPKQRKTLYAAIYNVYDSAAATYLFHATIVFVSLVDHLAFAIQVLAFYQNEQ